MNKKAQKGTDSVNKRTIIYLVCGVLVAAAVFTAALVLALDSEDTPVSATTEPELDVMLGSAGLTDSMLREMALGNDFHPETRLLNIRDNQISDLTMLAGLVHLEYLDISFNLWRNVTQLSPFIYLETLIASRNQVVRLDSFPYLPYLSRLDLMHNGIGDVSPLAQLTNLTSLELSQNRVTDISPLIGLTNLTLLSLAGNEISDVSALAALTRLTHLDLSFNDISDISALAVLTELSSLNLRHNPNLSHEAIHELQGVLYNTNIQYSTIDEIERRADFSNRGMFDNELNTLVTMGLSDVSAIERIEPNVRHLNLSNNNIVLAGLLGHPRDGLLELVWLDLSGNDIENVGQLANLVNLEFLDLRNNPRLTQEAVDALRAELPDTEILF